MIEKKPSVSAISKTLYVSHVGKGHISPTSNKKVQVHLLSDNIEEVRL